MSNDSLQGVRFRHAAQGDELVLGRFGFDGVKEFGRREDEEECVTRIPHGTILFITGADKKVTMAIFGCSEDEVPCDGLIFVDQPNTLILLKDLPLGTSAEVHRLPGKTCAAEAQVHEWSGRI